jgi:hypothetical protein
VAAHGARVQDADGVDGPAGDVVLKAAADGFDFG